MPSKRNLRASIDAPAEQTETTQQQAEHVEGQQVEAPQAEMTETAAALQPATETAPTTEATEGAATPPTEPTSEKKPEVKKPTRTVKPLGGMMYRLKCLTWEHPDWDTDQLVAELKKEGFTPSKVSVQTIRADFLHSMRVLAFLGVRGLGKFVKVERE